MDQEAKRGAEVAAMVAQVALPPGVTVRPWLAGDFPAVQALAAAEGWTTMITQAEAARQAWVGSWPALVALDTGQAGPEGEVVGFLRAISDGAVTVYVADLLVAPSWRGQGIARGLVDLCQRLYPGSRLDLLASSSSQGFYTQLGFRPFAGFRRSWAEAGPHGEG